MSSRMRFRYEAFAVAHATPVWSEGGSEVNPGTHGVVTLMSLAESLWPILSERCARSGLLKSGRKIRWSVACPCGYGSAHSYGGVQREPSPIFRRVYAAVHIYTRLLRRGGALLYSCLYSDYTSSLKGGARGNEVAPPSPGLLPPPASRWEFCLLRSSSAGGASKTIGGLVGE